MLESPSRIVLAIVAACFLLTLIVLFRSGGDETETQQPRPGSVTSQTAKAKPANQFAHRDGGSGSTFSGDVEHPRNLPGSGMEAPRAGSVQNSEGKVAPPHDNKPLDAAAGTGRNLAAEPVPAAEPGAGVVPVGATGGGIDPAALAAIPGAPQNASLAVPFNGNGQSLGSMAPLVEENVIYDLDDGAYFPPDARFAFGDAGSVQNNAGTIAFWIKPNWDGTDPRNASLLQFHTEDWSNRLQIFKNGIYLRY